MGSHACCASLMGQHGLSQDLSACVYFAAAQVALGAVDHGVAIVRPPGHHAEEGECMGFCVFNNVAVAAKLATTRWGLERVSADLPPHCAALSTHAAARTSGWCYCVEGRAPSWCVWEPGLLWR